MDTLGPHSTDKGKGKAASQSKTNVSQQPDATAQNQPNLVNRIAASAVGLTRGLAGPSNGALASTLAASAASSGKIVPSASNGSASPASEALQNHSTPLSSRTNGSGLGEAFRTNQHDLHTANEFEQFSTTQDPFHSLDSLATEPNSTSWTSEFHTNHSNSSPNHNHRHHEQQHQHQHHSPAVDYDDGAEVRALLSDPYFVAMTDVYDTQDPTAADAADLFSHDFTADEQEAVAKITADLSPVPVHGRVAASNPLNLLPNFDAERAIATDEQQQQQHVHVFKSAAQRERWFAEWNDVLDGYTDEVWGELLPVVRATKQHLDDVKAGNGALDTTAVARLKMILGHVNEQQQAGNVQAQRQGAEQVSRASVLPGDSVVRTGQRSVQHSQERRERSMSAESDTAAQKFHCPWISCHERFHSLNELRKHSATHKTYPCPHTSCDESFLAREEWAKHIRVAHHDLLDNYSNLEEGQGDMER